MLRIAPIRCSEASSPGINNICRPSPLIAFASKSACARLRASSKGIDALASKCCTDGN